MINVLFDSCFVGYKQHEWTKKNICFFQHFSAFMLHIGIRKNKIWMTNRSRKRIKALIGRISVDFFKTQKRRQFFTLNFVCLVVGSIEFRILFLHFPQIKTISSFMCYVKFAQFIQIINATTTQMDFGDNKNCCPITWSRDNENIRHIR